MSFKRVFKEDRDQWSWRHVVLMSYWLITVVPMLVCILGGLLAEKGDEFLGKLRKWANPNSYGRWTD